jgi:hypothetical protein
MILKWAVKKWDGGMDWVYVAQETDKWGIFV